MNMFARLTCDGKPINAYHTKIVTLEAHGLSYRMKDGKLYAPDHYELYGRVVSDWVDISDLTSSQLTSWLKNRNAK